MMRKIIYNNVLASAVSSHSVVILHCVLALTSSNFILGNTQCKQASVYRNPGQHMINRFACLTFTLPVRASRIPNNSVTEILLKVSAFAIVDD